MANRTPRIGYPNRLRGSATLLYASGAQDSSPISNLQNVALGERWVSEVGWTIVEGFNDSLDFTEGTTGDATATIPAGVYSTGAALAQAIEDAMNAAATDNEYTVSYSTSTKKFTILRSVGSATIGLEWSTGSNAGVSIGEDIGFVISADDTGATSYTSDNASYQSRHYVELDLGSALDVRLWALFNHNVSSSAVITRQANASAAWSSPSLNATTWSTSVGDEKMNRWEDSAVTYRYHRLLIDDVQNDDGYCSIGSFFLGDYIQPGRSFQQGYGEDHLDLSTIQRADQGAGFQTRRSEPFTFSGTWYRLSRSDRDTLFSMHRAEGRGNFVVFALDPLNYPSADTYYGQIMAGPGSVQRVGDGTPPDRFDIRFSFVESKV